MTDIKYCPNCQKELSISEQTCPDCKYEFIIVEKKAETNSVSKTDRYDPTPAFLWTALGFIFPPLGAILYFVLRKKWVLRAENSKDGAVLGIICWAIALVFILIFFVIKEEAV